jgi:predicted TIM-barrel fold metal-dependent hydrolase
VPHPDLPFSSEHYDPLWAEAQDLEMPISLHILTGHSYAKEGVNHGMRHYHDAVNTKLSDAADTLFDLIFFGVLHRFPRLQLVLVENEIGWLPFMLQQWDYYYRRFREEDPPPMREAPSFYFNRQVFATFFNDPVGAENFRYWGVDNCLWSNDYPHGNSTWPNSRNVFERQLGYLPPEAQAKLLRENVAKLYGLDLSVLTKTTTGETIHG